MSEMIVSTRDGMPCYRVGTIEFRPLTKDKIEAALLVQAESMRQECIALGVGIYEERGAPEEMQQTFREVIKDGVTMIAVDITTDEVVSVSFNKIMVPLKKGDKDDFGDFVKRTIKHQSCLALFNFLDEIESRVNIFERYNVEAAMEIFYMGTLASYQGRSIGRHLIEATLDYTRGLRTGRSRKVNVDERILEELAIPDVVYAVFASNYSQRVGAKLNFECLAEVQYADYFCGSRRLSDRIGNVHKTAKLAAYKL